MKVTSENYFDVGQALYWFCSLHHEGQGSEKYRILSNLGYNPAMSERFPDTEESKEIFGQMVKGDLDFVDLFNSLQEFQNGRND